MNISYFTPAGFGVGVFHFVFYNLVIPSGFILGFCSIVFQKCIKN